MNISTFIIKDFNNSKVKAFIIVSILLLLGPSTMAAISFSFNDASQKISAKIAEDISNFTGSISPKKDFSLAVLNFKIFNPKGYVNMDEYFSDILSTNLTERKESLMVLERLKLKNILKEQGLNASGFISDKGINIGKILNASYLILGNLIISDKYLGVAVRMVDVESGRIIWANYYELPLNSSISYIAYELNQFLWIKAVKKAIEKATKNLLKNIDFTDKIVAVNNLKTSPNTLGIEDISTSLLITEIAKNNVVVVEREKLESILNEISLSQSGLTEENKILKAGELLGATEIVMGNILLNQKGELYDIFGERKEVTIDGNINLKLVSINSSEILASVNEGFKEKF